MNFKRLALDTLINWKKKQQRKPLIIQGARQVGKTHLLKEFGQAYFNKIHYLNFEMNRSLAKAFDASLSPKNILNELSIIIDEVIDPLQDLIIFDEIQACPAALTSLKYFEEFYAEKYICAAGSLLGVYLNESFPVGKVEFLNLYPMSFFEFLLANKKDLLLETLKSGNISENVHEQAWNLFKHYLIVGGMPEVVQKYVATSDENILRRYESIRNLQNSLLNSYIADINKHAGKVNALHIEKVWFGTAFQLGTAVDTSVSKFVFKDVVSGYAGYKDLMHPIAWLEKANLLIRCPIAESAQEPLLSYCKENRFKLYLFDVGLLGAMIQLKPSTIHQYEFGTYKGFMVENFVANQLRLMNFQLISWNEKSAEVEFLLNDLDSIIPLEVKAGRITQAKSLSVYESKYHPKKSIVLNAKTPYTKGVREYWPLYLIEKLRDTQML